MSQSDSLLTSCFLNDLDLYVNSSPDSYQGTRAVWRIGEVHATRVRTAKARLVPLPRCSEGLKRRRISNKYARRPCGHRRRIGALGDRGPGAWGTPRRVP